MAIGALIGYLAPLVLKCELRKIIKDACLGFVGILIGFIGCALLPWPENTISYKLPSGVEVSSTMSRYQHPEWIAITFAVLFPLLYELYRFRRMRPSSI
jgi:hypothetical protein